MFKLVGVEQFTVGTAKCSVTIDAVDGFMYEYSLQVNGQNLEKFTENQSKIMCTWLYNLAGSSYRIVLGNFPVC
jgi:Fas apoptotic inhibitory molecule (FAIM1)